MRPYKYYKVYDLGPGDIWGPATVPYYYAKTSNCGYYWLYGLEFQELFEEMPDIEFGHADTFEELMQAISLHVVEIKILDLGHLLDGTI